MSSTNNGSTSRKLKSIIGILISLVLIIWVCLSVRWSEVQVALSAARPIELIPLTATLLIHYYLRAIRWKLLLPKHNHENLPVLLPFKSLWDSMMIGNLATYVLPLRAGEFIRPFVLTQSVNLSYPSSFISVVLERFLDLSMVLLSFGIMLGFVSGMPAGLVQGAMALSGLAVCILGFIIVGSFFPNRLLKVVDFFLRFVPKFIANKLRIFAEDLLLGAAVLKSPRVVVVTLFLSLLIWASCYYSYYLVFVALDIPVSLGAGIVIGVVLALAVAPPSAPGFVGVFELGCITAFALLGLGKDQAIAYSIVSHIYQYLLVLILGGLALLRQNLKLSDIRASAQQNG